MESPLIVSPEFDELALETLRAIGDSFPVIKQAADVHAHVDVSKTPTVADEDMIKLFSEWLKLKGLNSTEQCLQQELQKAVAELEQPKPEIAPIPLAEQPQENKDADTWDSHDDPGFVRVLARAGDEFYELWQEDVARSYFAQYGVMPAFEAGENTTAADEVFRQYCAQYSAQYAAYAQQYDPMVLAQYQQQMMQQQSAYQQQILSDAQRPMYPQQQATQDPAAYQYQVQQYEYLQQQQQQMISMQQQQQHHYLQKQHEEQVRAGNAAPLSHDHVLTPLVGKTTDFDVPAPAANGDAKSVKAAVEVIVEDTVEAQPESKVEGKDYYPGATQQVVQHFQQGSSGSVTIEHYPNQVEQKKKEPVYEAFELKIIYEVGRTGFEEQKDFPIKTHSVIAGRYQILEYLGSAAFSRAVQCVDLKTGQLVCIKIIRNSKDFFDQSLDEIKLLQYIKAQGDPDEKCVLQLYDHFYYKEHLFLVCELLRDNLYEFSKYTRETGDEPYFTIPRLQKVSLQVLTALQFIHSLNLIHCDLKPENILLKSYSRCEVKVIDFGSSCFTTDHLSSYVQSRCYRAPEVVLGLPYGCKIDLWSLGCILAELYTGRVLFHNDSISTMMARIVAICGDIPEKMLSKAKYCHRFYSRRGVMFEKHAKTGQLFFLYPKKCKLRHRMQTDDELFLSFVNELLQLDPERRPNATEALQHPFLKHDYGPINP